MSNIIEEINLTADEIDALDRLLDAAQAKEGDLTISDKGGVVAFTPGAALAIGVANLAFSLYTEYGKSLEERKEISYRIKKIASELVEVESRFDGSAPIDALTKLRSEVNVAKRSLKTKKSLKRE